MKTTSALVIGVTALLHQLGAYISVQAATCADYTGTACAAPKVDAATTTVCASTTCTTAECCVDQTCASYVTDGATSCTTDPLATARLCAGTTCTAEECCEPEATCDDHTCTAGTLDVTKRDDACPTAGCTDDSCCLEAVSTTCADYTCSGTGYTEVAANSATDCATDGCTDAQCCEAPDTCGVDHDYAVAAACTTGNGPALDTTVCPAAGCDDATCCVADETCADYRYACPSATEAAAITTACNGACTDAECCPDADASGALGSFCSSPLAVFGAAAVATVAAPLF